MIEYVCGLCGKEKIFTPSTDQFHLFISSKPLHTRSLPSLYALKVCRAIHRSLFQIWPMLSQHEREAVEGRNYDPPKTYQFPPFPSESYLFWPSSWLASVGTNVIFSKCVESYIFWVWRDSSILVLINTMALKKTLALLALRKSPE